MPKKIPESKRVRFEHSEYDKQTLRSILDMSYFTNKEKEKYLNVLATVWICIHEWELDDGLKNIRDLCKEFE